MLPSHSDPSHPRCSSPSNVYDTGNNVSRSFVNSSADFHKKRKSKWTIDDLDIGRKLGEGRFGSVHLAREKASRFVIALKILLKPRLVTKELMKQVQREIEIQSHLKHPNIVRMYSYFYDTKRIYLVLEYVPRGELSKEINRFGHFGDSRAATYVYQLSKALSYCHQNDVIHRDIKPENILLGVRGEVKIADFGSAVHLPASRRMTTFGTLNYLAPELFHLECVHDHRVDIWSLGILTFEMLTGHLPFDGETFQEISEKIQYADVSYPDTLNLGATKLITSMLKKLSSQRVSLNEIDNYDWIKMYAEFSVNQCLAALQDWENVSNQNSTCPSSSSYECSSTFVNTFSND
ncbi:unnamed protein product [Schistosoma rodhaini]|uniref:Aurora kinase n=2 Tax=Schistosoma rodhaini TaxID=6188 RepID=A0AA85FUC3_9TREM|nr:unnamed protein product [Schistosoma rodhaini]CAH8565399.1 unnamed protein product [Schistosoma rodhaini]